MNMRPLPALGISFVVANAPGSPWCWESARDAAAFVKGIFDHADYPMDLQADDARSVTLVTRRALSPFMGHLAMYVYPVDGSDAPLREWCIELDTTNPGPLPDSDVDFMHLFRAMLANLLDRMPGVLEVFLLDEDEPMAAE